MSREAPSVEGESPEVVPFQSQTLLESVLANSPIPTFIKNREGEYVYVNQAWVETMGRTQEEALGRTDEDFFSPKDATACREGDLLAMSSGEAVHRLESVRLPTGKDHPFSTVKFPVRDSEGEIIGICGLASDISDPIRAERARADERERLALEIHDDSLQVMAAVALRLDAFERLLSTPEQRESLSDLRETIGDSIERLRRLMLDLDSPTLEDSLGAAIEESLTDLCREVELNCTFVNKLKSEPDTLVTATVFRIAREAIFNVVKHASASHVQVELDQSERGIRLSVTDDGVGFEVRESPEGHLGLSSMRSRAQRAGGRWSLESSPGKGTRIEVWLPTSFQGPEGRRE